MYTGCNLWETHVSCRVLLDTIHISFLYFFLSFYFIIFLSLSVCVAWKFVFASFFFAFRFSIVQCSLIFLVSFVWTVVHLIGCTGLLGTDNWLANNSSNNIRAYDIQVLIYTLHRYFFFKFSSLEVTTFLERVYVWVCVCTCTLDLACKL